MVCCSLLSHPISANLEQHIAQQACCPHDEKTRGHFSSSLLPLCLHSLSVHGCEFVDVSDERGAWIEHSSVVSVGLSLFLKLEDEVVTLFYLPGVGVYCD